MSGMASTPPELLDDGVALDALESYPCLEIETFFALIDNQLTPQTRAAAERHIDTCDECRLLLADAAIAALSRTSAGTGAPPVGGVVGGRYRIERFVTRGG